ncbi:deaminase, partial [Bacteroides sp. AF25-18]
KKQDSQNVRQAYISIFRNRINVPITNNLSRR